MSTIMGFIDCEECDSEHAPVSGRCPYKIERDAAVVWDAAGAALTPTMIENFVNQVLQSGRGEPSEPYRRVLPEVQFEALLRCGWNRTAQSDTAERERIRASSEWVIDNTLPPAMFLIERSGMFGVIKKLCVWEPVDNEESLI
jgi:hypothetical protein